MCLIKKPLLTLTPPPPRGGGGGGGGVRVSKGFLIKNIGFLDLREMLENLPKRTFVRWGVGAGLLFLTFGAVLVPD